MFKIINSEDRTIGSEWDRAREEELEKLYAQFGSYVQNYMVDRLTISFSKSDCEKPGMKILYLE